MTHLAASLFFIIALLAATVAIHLTVRRYWLEIVLALRGELERPVTPAQAPSPFDRRRAAF